MDTTPAPDAAPDGTPTDAAPSPGYPPPPTPPTTGMDSFFASIRRTGLFRTDERWVGGVAGGLAARLGIDPLIVRGLFGIGALLGGVGLVLYGIGWLLMPEQRDGRIHLQQLFRGDFDAAVIGGIALVLFGFALPDWGWMGGNPRNGWVGGLVGIVITGVIIAIIVSSAGKSRGPGPTQPMGPTTTLRPTGPQYPASVPPAAVRRPEGTTMYPAPASGYPAPPQGGPGWPAYAPAMAPTAPPPPVPPAPPMAAYRPVPPPVPTTTLPRTKPAGPGSRAVGIVMALGLITLAALLYAEREGVYDGPVFAAAAAVVVILCGLGIVGAGALGRTSGALGAIAIITMPIALMASAATDVSFRPDGAFVGDGRFTPTTVAEAEDGYSWGVGDVTVDLTDLTDLTAGTTIDIPVHMGAGDVRVILPEDAAYSARVQVGAGDIDWLGSSVSSGVGNGWQTFESDAVQDGADPTMALELKVGAGKLTVEEQ